ncbi:MULTISPECIES: SusC/RagA family TonB-linked outer membrane protein [Niastella]|uniref:SusC/RagA family TonB-linked outer membrane protein n=1 Tax=Niastella soli TaxID=2821487 RepID=A0ABS3Z209_9BACT|nr:SusC/RagA family TonB-linked outer membrane protein [Niastella soli]MBO9204183.1 SusC/RagA family TonB-linked outer membrane protein [Niastella soli]
MQKTALVCRSFIAGMAITRRNASDGGCEKNSSWKKLLCVMKLTFIFLTVAFLNVSARGLSQSVTIKVKNAPLAQVFREIERQTGYVFIYGKSMLEKTTSVNLQVANAALPEVLNLCFRNQGITYTVEDNKYIIVKPKPAAAASLPLVKQASNLLYGDPVKGRVTADDGTPLNGASIVIKGSTVSGMANNDGVFTINAAEGDVLVVSFVGFETREIKVTGAMLGSMLSVTLKAKRSLLDEMVVIAYGTTSLRKSTGSVSSVTAQEISKQPVANPLAALPGRISGAVIAQDNGMPGSAVKIQIRGQGSLSQGDVPLFIIDGVPFTNFNGGSPATDNLNAFGTSGANGGVSPFSLINPNDIERIDVLKDADATSIYGSRGANGVIMITTKKGKAGKTTVNASFYQGTGKVSRFIPMLNLEQYLAMRREAFTNSNQTPTAANAPDLKVWDTTKSTDWQKFLLGGTAHTTDAQASISGGNGGTRFLFNSAYHRETTVFPGNNEAKRLSFRLNADHTTRDNKFNIGVMVSYANDVTNLLADDISSAYNLPPNLPLYNADGTLYWYSGFTNPLGRLKKTYKGNSNNLIGNLTLRYTILPGLNLKATLGYTKTDLDQKKANPYSSDNPTSTLGSYAYFADNKAGNYIIEPTIDYTRKLGEGKLTALAGASLQSNTADGYQIYASNYSSEALLGSMIAAGTLQVYYNNIQRYKYAAGFGRLTYDYKGKYIVNANFRRDGSSRFAPANRFNNFGSVGAAWVFSEEMFARNDLSFLSFGKLRGSIGTSGNDQISNYLYLDLYNAGTPLLGNGTLNPQPVLLNDNIQWESRRKYDIGIDLGFLRDRILLTANYYETRSGNQISSVSMPTQTGISAKTVNIPAVITNTGVEFDLRTTNIKTKELEWKTALNVTFNRNKLVKWPGLENSFNASSYIVGKPLNVAQLYHFQGIDPATGVAVYDDKDGSGSITSAGDRYAMPMGNPYYGGLSNTVIYKNFQLDVTFQFNHRKARTNLFPSPVPVGSLLNQNTSVLNHWMKTGDAAMYPAYKTSGADYNYSASDVTWGDASFAKLRSASLAYMVPQAWIKRLKMADCTISVQGQNLFLFSKNKYLYDPETTIQGGPAGIGTGTLGAVMPPLRTIVFGINCSF